MMLTVGIQGEKKEQVTQENTALTMKSGALKVYATPAMIALMEQAAYTSVAGELEEGQGTVGTLMNVSHISATPVGMEVTAKSELVKVDGRKLVFHVEAYDERGKIGEGEHERFIIDNEKFQNEGNRNHNDHFMGSQQKGLTGYTTGIQGYIVYDHSVDHNGSHDNCVNCVFKFSFWHKNILLLIMSYVLFVIIRRMCVSNINNRFISI